MVDVASKQQLTALFLSTMVTCTRIHTTAKKLTNQMGNLCCAREHSVQFFVQIFYTVKLHSLTWSVWGHLPLFKFCYTILSNVMLFCYQMC